MTREEYWKECLSEAACECGLEVTDHQLDVLAEAVQGAHENIGMAFHQPENPLGEENRKLEAALKKEQSKVHCRHCDGRGRIYTQGPHHGSDSQCWKCGGEGKYVP